MTLTITIDCDNAAFDRPTGREVYKILQCVARTVRPCGSRRVVGQVLEDLRLRDSNGNTVGKVEVSE